MFRGFNQEVGFMLGNGWALRKKALGCLNGLLRRLSWLWRRGRHSLAKWTVSDVL